MTRLDNMRDSLSDLRAEAADAWADMEPGTRRALWIAGGVVATAVLLLAVWAVIPSRDPARLLQDPLAVAQFVHSDEFKKAPADARRPYMKAARQHQQAIADARKAGKIDRRTYRAAYLAAWMERRVSDMEDYYAKPPTKRQAHLDGMLGYPAPKPAAHNEKPKSASDPGSLYNENDPADKAEFEAMKDRFEDSFLDAWSSDRKQQYKQFRRAYTERRTQLEAVAASKRPAGSPVAK